MKRLLIVLAALIAVPCFAQITFYQSVTNGTYLTGTPTSVSSNNGAWFQVGTATIIPPVYSLGHGALASTYDITNFIEISIGGTNAPVIIAVVSPQTTNANDADSYSLSPQKLTVYSRIVMLSTNSMPVVGQIVTGVNQVQ